MNTLEAAPPPSRLQRLGAVGLLLLLSTLPFVESFQVPFIFDDVTIIDRNHDMRQLWPITKAMEAPRMSTAAGRPLVSYSFAVNYAISGLDVWSYHVYNLLVHLLCVLLVYRIVRRLGDSPALADKPAYTSRPFAWILALVWGVHPLNSETVIYVAQRTELMFAAFALGGFWFLLRALRRPDRVAGLPTQAAVVLMVTLSALCKETAACIPPLVLLFDRAFISTTFRGAFRSHGLMYLGLLLPIAVSILIAMDGHRGGLVTDDPEIVWRYLLTQGAVICWYLRLSVIPYPLSVTYDWDLVKGLVDSLPWSALVLGMLLASFYGVWRRPILGFVGMWFFLILAPTSSVIPIMTEVVGERRMYLPLLSVLVVIAVVGLTVGRWFVTREHRKTWLWPSAAGFGVCLALVYGVTTYYRSLDYESALKLWEQTIRHHPDSWLARTNMAGVLILMNRPDEASRYISEVLARYPEAPRAQFIKAMIDVKRNDWDAAANGFMRSAMNEGGTADDYAYAGLAFGMVGNTEASARAFNQALSIDPQNSQALIFIGVIHDRNGEYEKAIEWYQKAIDLYPENAGAYGNMAHSLSRMGRKDEARKLFEKAWNMFPESFEITMNHANFLAAQDDYAAAVPVFRHAVELSPRHAPAQLNLAVSLARMGSPEADIEFRKLVALHPDHLEGHRQYAQYLMRRDELVRADPIIRAGLQIAPEDPTLRAMATEINARLYGQADPPPPAPGITPAPGSTPALESTPENTSGSADTPDAPGGGVDASGDADASGGTSGGTSGGGGEGEGVEVPVVDQRFETHTVPSAEPSREVAPHRPVADESQDAVMTPEGF